MKTKTSNPKKTFKRLIQLFLICIGIGLSNLGSAQCGVTLTDSVNANGAVTFYAHPTNKTGTYYDYYIWSPGDGTGPFTVFNSNSYTHTYANNTWYTMYVTMVDSAPSACYATDSIQVHITNAPVCNLVASFTTSYGSNGTVTFTSTSTGTDASTQYYWDPGDGSSMVLGGSPYTYTYSQNGSYNAFLLAQDPNGLECSAVAAQNVTITTVATTSNTCSVSLTDSVGANGAITFYAHPTNEAGIGTYYDYYTWYPGDGTGPFTIFYNNSFTHTYPTNGPYKLSVTMVDSGVSACYATDTMDINVTNAANTCNIAASFTTTNGANGAVTFTSTSTGTSSRDIYLWNPGDGSGTVSGGPAFNYVYANDGSYVISLTIMDSNNLTCSATAARWDSITNVCSYTNMCNLSANFTTNIGSDGLVNFTSTSTGTTPSTIFIWVPGVYNGYGNFPYAYGAGLTSYSYNYTYNGTYFAYLTLYDTVSGCYDWSWNMITINNTAGCNLHASFTDNVKSNGQVTFTSTSTGTNGGTIYQWDPGDGSGLQYGSSTFNYTYYYNGTYNVTLDITDSLGQCNSIDTMSVNINNADSCLYASYMDSTGTATYIGHDSITGQPDTITYTVYYFYSISDTSCNDSTGRRAQQRVLGGSKQSQVVYMWNFGDGTKVSGLGLTNPNHQYAKAGEYTTSLAIKYKGSVRQSRAIHSVNASPLGIATIAAPTGTLSIYPNPNTGQFKVSLSNVPSGQTPEVHITNVLGEEVYNTTSAASDNKLNKEIDLQSAAPGVYFVQIVTAGKVFTTKMIIGR